MQSGEPELKFAGANYKDISSDLPLDHIDWQMVDVPQIP